MWGLRAKVGMGTLLALAGGVALLADTRQASSKASQITELRDRFLVENVARPVRDRLGRPPVRQGPHRDFDQRRDRSAAILPVPFLIPYPAIGPSCVEQVCNLVGSLGCDTDQRILRVLRMCSGNYSGDCVRAACAKLISVECDTLDAIAPMVAACRTNFSGSCLDTACNLLGDVQCQSQEALARILEACMGNVDGSCVSAVCAKLGPAACTTMEEIALVARSCGTYGY